MDGTLDGNNTGNPQVPLNQSDRVFECDLVPLGAASELDGQWRAYVDGQESSIVSLNMSGGRAIISPPDPPGYYDKVGTVTIVCVFESPSGDPLFQFNRTLEVAGRLCSVVIGHARHAVVILLSCVRSSCGVLRYVLSQWGEAFMLVRDALHCIALHCSALRCLSMLSTGLRCVALRCLDPGCVACSGALLCCLLVRVVSVDQGLAKAGRMCLCSCASACVRASMCVRVQFVS